MPKGGRSRVDKSQACPAQSRNVANKTTIEKRSSLKKWECTPPFNTPISDPKPSLKPQSPGQSANYPDDILYIGGYRNVQPAKIPFFSKTTVNVL